METMKARKVKTKIKAKANKVLCIHEGITCNINSRISLKAYFYSNFCSNNPNRFFQ